MILIGLGHKARRGKNSAADAIIAAYPEVDIKSYGFADALKREVNEAADATGGMFNLFQHLSIHGVALEGGKRLRIPSWVQYDAGAPMGDPLCPYGKQRTLLQWWGYEYRRQSCSKFYWVKALKAQLDIDHPQVALITDMRYQNEFFWVKANGGMTVNVERTGYVDTVVSTNPTHVSECELDGAPYNYTLSAPEDGLDELRTDAVTLFNMIVVTLHPQEVPLDVTA